MVMIRLGLCTDATGDSDDVMDDLEQPQDDMTKTELCDVIDGLLIDVPVADYPIVADTLSPRWIIGG